MAEVIEVATLFKDSSMPIPKWFKYGQQIYKISGVNLVHAIKRGAKRILVFNVTDDGGGHTLVFDTESLKWTMEESNPF